MPVQDPPASKIAPGFLYNTQRHRTTGHVYYSKHDVKLVAKEGVRLVPIRLDFEVDGVKVEDRFTWNLNETLIAPEQFAQLLVDDIYDSGSIPVGQLVNQIAQAIRKQCEAWQEAVHDGEDAAMQLQERIGLENNNHDDMMSGTALNDHQDNNDSCQEADNKQDTTNEAESVPSKEEAVELNWRTLIKLDLQLGPVHLIDQFEWPLLPSLTTTPLKSCSTVDENKKSATGAQLIIDPTPESFAKILCEDLGVGGEFISTVAYAVREQLYQARLNFDESPKAFDLTEPPLRLPVDSEWEPLMEELSDGEIERRSKEQERTYRRLRRSTRFVTNAIVLHRGGAVLNSRPPPQHYDDEDVDGSTDEDDDFETAQAPRPATNPASFVQAPRFQRQTRRPTFAPGTYRFTASDYPVNRPLPYGSTDGSRLFQQQQQYATMAALGPPMTTPASAFFRSPSRSNASHSSGTAATKIPYRNYKPTSEEESEILEKLAKTQNKSLPVAASPPKNHRGFGASAQKFNGDGSLDVGEFRAKWRCGWCLLSGKFTPTLRRGPMGGKTLCNACGIWYAKHGNLPKERYHEHEND